MKKSKKTLMHKVGLHLTILDYKIRGTIAGKYKTFRSVAYKYMTFEEIVEYERKIHSETN